MKKLRTILLVVLALLLAGCKSAQSAKSQAGVKGTSPASGKSYFWDKDMRPAIAAAPQAPEVQPAAETAEQQPAQAETAQNAKPAVKPAQRPSGQADLVIDRPTASRLGIAPQQIDEALYDAFGQRHAPVPADVEFPAIGPFRICAGDRCRARGS